MKLFTSCWPSSLDSVADTNCADVLMEIYVGSLLLRSTDVCLHV